MTWGHSKNLAETILISAKKLLRAKNAGKKIESLIFGSSVNDLEKYKKHSQKIEFVGR